MIFCSYLYNNYLGIHKNHTKQTHWNRSMREILMFFADYQFGQFVFRPSEVNTHSTFGNPFWIPETAETYARVTKA